MRWFFESVFLSSGQERILSASAGKKNQMIRMPPLSALETIEA